MHHSPMTLLKRETSTDVRSYAPIAQSLYHIDKVTEETLTKKFDIAFFMAKEGIAFNKMNALSMLEERCGVALGEGYKNDLACATFTDYIGRELHENLTDTLHKVKFFSLQMDGSTDCANIEEELFLVVYFDPYSSLGTVQVKNVYFCAKQQPSVDAPGLYECLKGALTYLQLDQTSKLIGLGCDRASVNMGARALKGLVKEERPWIVVWCFAHRLELAIKDALKNTFSTINEMMLRLYYIYCKAPKKCREIEDLITELSECLNFPQVVDVDRSQRQPCSEFIQSGMVEIVQSC